MHLCEKKLCGTKLYLSEEETRFGQLDGHSTRVRSGLSANYYSLKLILKSKRLSVIMRTIKCG